MKLSTSRAYDELGRVTSKTVPYIGTSTYIYDIIAGVPAGCTKERTTDPKGSVTEKVTDKAGRLWQVKSDGQTTAYEYYANGNRKSVTYPDGAKEEYTYYRDNSIWTLTNKKAGGSIIDTYTYTYDASHNQNSKTDSKGTTHYTYDVLNRLESITEPGGRLTSYIYDEAGNRQSETVTTESGTIVTTYTYNEQNRLMSTTSQSGQTTEKVLYSYDSNGNMTGRTKSVTGPVTGASQEFYLAKAGVTANTLNVIGLLNDLFVTDYKTQDGISSFLGSDNSALGTKINGERYRDI